MLCLLIFEKISHLIIAGNLNSGLSYLITTVSICVFNRNEKDYRHENKNACSERISTHSWTCLPKYRWQNSHSSFTSYMYYVKPFGFAKTYTTYYINSFNFLFSISLNNHLSMGRTEKTKI